LRYGLPLLTVLAAALLTHLLPPVAQGTPAAFFYAAVTLSALYGERGAGWIALLLAALLLAYRFFWPLPAWQAAGAASLQLLVFLLVASLIVLLTRRMQREQAQLFTERETLQTTLTSIGDGVITTDIQGNVTYLNPTAAQLTGWSLAAARQRSLAEIFSLIHEQTRQSITSPMEQVLRTGAMVRLTNHTILVARDGREYPIHDSAAPLRNHKGEIVGVVLVFQDDSQRRQTIQQLAKSEERFRALFEQAATGMAQVGLDGKYWRVNQRLCALLGYSAEELLQRTPYELTHPDDLDINLENNHRMLRF
jgi:PAS domain S-box-containing protein